MMIVGRSYHLTPPRKQGRRSDSEKSRPQSSSPQASRDETKRFGWRPASYEEHVADWTRVEERRKATAAAKMGELPKAAAGDALPISPETLAIQPSKTRSQPLAIPRRSRQEVQRSMIAQRRKDSASSIGIANDAALNTSRAVAAQVATLLAMTSIPRKKNFPRPREAVFQRMSSQELVEHWKQLELEDDVPSAPTMEILLSPPDSDDLLPRTLSYESFGRSSPSLSRSSSSESISSLDAEDSSVPSWATPSTPGSPRRTDGSVSGSKERTLSSPPSVNCIEDHPLLDYPETQARPIQTAKAIRSPASTRLSSHKALAKERQKQRSSSSSMSALSLSLNALRVAARSFSNFAAPSLTVLPDDHLSRGLFGSYGQHPAYPAEMRPKPLVGPPTPAMRRYLNPSHSTVPGEFHLHGASWDHLDLEVVAAASVPIIDENGYVDSTALPAVIKMQTYARITSGNPRRVSRSTAGTRAAFPAMVTTAQADTVMRINRPRREPRENADFLRVCVLEMSMRRAGKLEAVSVGGVGAGKARFWLPPRTDGCDDEESAWREVESVLVDGRRVPKRWIGVVAVR